VRRWIAGAMPALLARVVLGMAEGAARTPAGSAPGGDLYTDTSEAAGHGSH
jgi:hypothetical protein